MKKNYLRKVAALVFIGLVTLAAAFPVLAIPPTCEPPDCQVGADPLPPTVDITSPASGAIKPAPGSFSVQVNATADESQGVALVSVKFYVDNVLKTTLTAPPYNFDVNGLKAGSHTFKAVALDDINQTSSDSVGVTVQGGVNFPPVVAITGPSNLSSAAAPATFSLTATASDSDGAITSVQFKSGSTVLATDTASPYSFSYAGLAVGTYSVTAVAFDNNGGVTSSTPVTLYVYPASNSVPTVSLTGPADGTSQPAGGVFNLTASASDPGGSVAVVKFLANGVLVGTDSTSPYTFAYTPSTPGSVALTAVAVDNYHATATSAARNVTVTAAATVSETRRFVYDGNHQLCKTINPESGSTVIAYDAAGNIDWTADGLALPSTTSCDRTASVITDDKKTTRTYDDLNRLVAVATPNHTADVLTEYYPDGKVKKLTAANPGGYNVTTEYTYNKRGLLTSETQTNDPVQYTLFYAYNANAFLSSLTYPDKQIVSYSPDALGRTTAVVGAQTYANGVSYYPNGAISGFQYGGLANVAHSMTQNLRQLPRQSRDAMTGTGAWTILDDTYDYDATGNVVAITDQAQAGATSRAIAYDGLDRLTSATGIWGAAAYTYDALDNLRSADQGPRQYRYNYNSTTWRLDAIKDPAGSQILAFGYDNQGNITSKNTQSFNFDFANRMSTAGVLSGAGVQTYRYDGMGRRVQTTDPDGSTTYWVYSQAGQVLYSSEARRSRNISYIYLGNSQVATRTVAFGTGAAAVRFQFTDALGSPVADANASVASASVNRTNYAPYGEALAPAAVDGTGYTGHVMDAGTGLTYMQQRYYDPSVGRFLSKDPAESEFNRFSYASNNPMHFVDPDGRQVVEPAREEARPESDEVQREEQKWEDKDAERDRDEKVAAGGPYPAIDPISGQADPKCQGENPYSILPEFNKEEPDMSGWEKETGSYTNLHESGRTYDGKGSRERSQESGRRVERQTGDRHVATEWTRAPTQREAFKQESVRLQAHGGPASSSNYNKVESPGAKMRQNDGDE